SRATDAVVGEAAAAHGSRIEEVAGVDQTAGDHQPADLLEVQPPELVPFGEHDEHARPLAGRVGVGRHLDAVDGAADRRVVGPQARASLLQAVQHLDGWRAPQVVGAGLEREAPRRHHDVVEAAPGHALDLAYDP